jgi:hypothetical protein
LLPVQKTTTQAQLDAADAAMTGPTDYADVVHDLVAQLNDFQFGAKTKDLNGIRARDAKAGGESGFADFDAYTSNAQDAARKLVSVGRAAVPELTLLFKANYLKPDKGSDGAQAAQVTYYSAWALARIHVAEAAQALTPLLTNASARSDLRLIAVDAVGWEKSDDGAAVLQKVAATDPEPEMRKRALGQLTMTREFWATSEPVFVRALSDPSEDIRMQAVKACHFAHFFLSANSKLIELIEKDSSSTVRIFAMLTLARLKVRHALPALIRVLAQNDADEKIKKQALMTLSAISGVSPRNADGALIWWEKAGKQEYELFAANEKRAEDEKAGTQTLPLKAAPKFEPAESTPEIRPSKPLLNAEIITPDDLVAPTPFGPAQRVGAKVEIPDASKPEPPPTPEPPPGTRIIDGDEKLSPSESTGSQRRRRRQAEQK